MKILLDENLPQQLRHEFPGHHVFTVGYMGWAGLKNGALLAIAGEYGFEVLVTMDNGVAYQQNHSTLSVSVLIVGAASNDMNHLLPYMARVLECLQTLPPCSIQKIV